jgi:hypothetical protein
MTDYPVSEKLAEIRDGRVAINEFVEWLGGQGIALCSVPEGQAHFQPIARQTDALVMEMYEIDEKELERERRAMIAGLGGW